MRAFSVDDLFGMPLLHAELTKGEEK
jgi:hypothetical protein